MLGCTSRDIVGSIYEFNNYKSKDFQLFSNKMEFTDDSILTFATADWLLSEGDICEYYARYAKQYSCPMGGYGSGFIRWVRRMAEGDYSPYNSCGKGSAMRVGPVGWAFDTKEEILLSFRQNVPIIILRASKAHKQLLFVCLWLDPRSQRTLYA